MDGMISQQDGSTDRDATMMRVGLTEVAEAPVESRITQAGPVGPVAAPVVCTITFLIALLAVEAFRTACTGNEATLQHHAGEERKNCGKRINEEQVSKEAAHHPGTGLR